MIQPIEQEKIGQTLIEYGKLCSNDILKFLLKISICSRNFSIRKELVIIEIRNIMHRKIGMHEKKANLFFSLTNLVIYLQILPQQFRILLQPFYLSQCAIGGRSLWHGSVHGFRGKQFFLFLKKFVK